MVASLEEGGSMHRGLLEEEIGEAKTGCGEEILLCAAQNGRRSVFVPSQRFRGPLWSAAPWLFANTALLITYYNGVMMPFFEINFFPGAGPFDHDVVRTTILFLNGLYYQGYMGGFALVGFIAVVIPILKFLSCALLLVPLAFREGSRVVTPWQRFSMEFLRVTVSYQICDIFMAMVLIAWADFPACRSRLLYGAPMFTTYIVGSILLLIRMDGMLTPKQEEASCSKTALPAAGIDRPAVVFLSCLFFPCFWGGILQPVMKMQILAEHLHLGILQNELSVWGMLLHLRSALNSGVLLFCGCVIVVAPNLYVAALLCWACVPSSRVARMVADASRQWAMLDAFVLSIWVSLGSLRPDIGND